jgi:hypothetical protein
MRDGMYVYIRVGMCGGSVSWKRILAAKHRKKQKGR